MEKKEKICPVPTKEFKWTTLFPRFAKKATISSNNKTARTISGQYTGSSNRLLIGSKLTRLAEVIMKVR